MRRDKRNKIRQEFICKIDKDPDVTAPEAQVIREILDRDYSAEKRVSFVSQRKMARHMKLSRATVQRAVRKAEDRKWITRKAIPGSNGKEYQINYEEIQDTIGFINEWLREIDKLDSC